MNSSERWYYVYMYRKPDGWGGMYKALARDQPKVKPTLPPMVPNTPRRGPLFGQIIEMVAPKEYPHARYKLMKYNRVMVYRKDHKMLTQTYLHHLVEECGYDLV